MSEYPAIEALQKELENWNSLSKKTPYHNKPKKFPIFVATLVEALNQNPDEALKIASEFRHDDLGKALLGEWIKLNSDIKKLILEYTKCSGPWAKAAIIISAANSSGEPECSFSLFKTACVSLYPEGRVTKSSIDKSICDLVWGNINASDYNLLKQLKWNDPVKKEDKRVIEVLISSAFIGRDNEEQHHQLEWLRILPKLPNRLLIDREITDRIKKEFGGWQSDLKQSALQVLETVDDTKTRLFFVLNRDVEGRPIYTENKSTPSPETIPFKNEKSVRSTDRFGEALEKLRDTHKEILTNQEKEKDKSERRLKELQIEYSSIEEDLSGRNNEIKNLRDEIQRVESNRIKIEAKKDELETHIANLKKDHEKEKAGLNNQIEDLKLNLEAEKKKRDAHIEQEVITLKNKIQKMISPEFRDIRKLGDDANSQGMVIKKIRRIDQCLTKLDLLKAK